MLGTIVNTVSVLIGSLFGNLIKKGINERYSDILKSAIGIAVLFIGLNSALSNLLDENASSLLFIISLCIGGLIGEYVDIEGKLEQLGNKLQSRFGSKENSIAASFVSASLIFCVGSMAILGSIESSIKGDHTILYAKSILDGVMSVIIASTMGIGVIFSAFAVLVYQGTITVFASFIEPYLTNDMIREMSIVGGILIFCIGLNILDIKKVKTGNLLPSMFVPILYYAIINIF